MFRNISTWHVWKLIWINGSNLCSTFFQAAIKHRITEKEPIFLNKKYERLQKKVRRSVVLSHYYLKHQIIYNSLKTNIPQSSIDDLILMNFNLVLIFTTFNTRITKIGAVWWRKIYFFMNHNPKEIMMTMMMMKSKLR